MEMMISVKQPLMITRRERKEITFDHKRTFKVDLEKARTLSLSLAIKATQTNVLTNVSVPAIAADKNCDPMLQKVAKRSLVGILYAIGFLAWFLSSF